MTLGKGGFGHDSVRAAPDGTLAACCIQPVNNDPSVPPDTVTKVAVYRSASGWRLVVRGRRRHGRDRNGLRLRKRARARDHPGGARGDAGVPGRARPRPRRGGRRRRRAPARARETARARPGAGRDDRRLGPQRPRLSGEDQAARVQPHRAGLRERRRRGATTFPARPDSTAERPTNPRCARSAPARSPPGSARAHAGAWRSNAMAASTRPRAARPRPGDPPRRGLQLRLRPCHERATTR